MRNGKSSKNSLTIVILSVLLGIFILLTSWFSFGEWVWKERNSLTHGQLRFSQESLNRCKSDTGWVEGE